MRHLFLISLTGILWLSHVLANPVQVTILHTNDRHSHFRPEKTPLGLGGDARLKTAVDRIRAETPEALLVDGGDWSEGNIYYYDGMGDEDLRMMDRIGYDFAVVGNHDWINGPDALLDSLARVEPKTGILGANLDPTGFARADEFRHRIAHYGIREINGVKIAFIGLTTYEFIYDRFVSPVKITELNSTANRLASQLKKQVDVVVVISHNSIANNRSLLEGAPAVDLVIGAHDHVQLTEAIEVLRSGGRPGWIVEAGCWGHYLGRVDLEVERHQVSLARYQLIQLDRSVPEDPVVLKDLDLLDKKIENHYGPIFTDTIGQSEVEFHRSGINNPMGNLVVDAYRNFTRADFSIEVINFIYGEIHRGSINSVDAFNSNPAVYSAEKNKTWTLKVLPITGRMLEIFLNIAYSTKKLGDFSLINVSGLSFKFDPLFYLNENKRLPLTTHLLSSGTLNGTLNSMTERFSLGTESFPMVQDIRVNDQPIEANKTYRMATGGGLIYAMEYINKHILNFIPLKQLHDTGIENWRVLADFIRSHSPLTFNALQNQNRIRTLRQDLGVNENEIHWALIRDTPEGQLTRVTVKVQNYGLTAYEPSDHLPAEIQLMVNKNGIDYSKTPAYSPLSDARPIPALAPGESKEFTWEVNLPAYLSGSLPTVPNSSALYAVIAQIHGVETEMNTSNKEATLFFSAIR